MHRRRLTPSLLVLALALTSVVAATVPAGAAPGPGVVPAVAAAVPAATTSATSSEVFSVPASGSWTVDGRGYGHGRGLSQWGSQGAAQQGVSAAKILAFYYPGTTSGTVSNTTLQVGLAAYSPTTSVTVWNTPGTEITVHGTASGKASTTTAAGRYTVTVSGSTVTVVRRSSYGAAPDSPRVFTGEVTFTAPQGVVVAPSAASTSGTWYRGTMRVLPTSGSGFDVANLVLLEDYLRGVVPRESPAYWEPAALQAQAVAARSYVMWKKAHATGAVDTCDTTSCQVYGGAGTVTHTGVVTAKEYASTDAAIAATAGQIRTYGGKVAFTEFSSSNGGWTRASSVAYQQAAADTWTGTATGDTVTTWTTTLSVATVQRSCPSSGKLEQLVVLARDGNGPLGGRVTSVRLDCTTGSTTLSNPSFGMRSTWWAPRPTTPVVSSLVRSTSSISSGGKVSVSAVPNMGMTWKLEVTDERTGRTAFATTGSATAGVRFTSTWNGRTDDGTVVGAGTYRLTLSGTDGAGTTSKSVSTTVRVGTAADPATVSSVALVGSGAYVPVTPVRLLDTRETFGSLGARQRVDVSVAGAAGVPADATAVVLNVTAVHADQETHLRLWPAGQAMPDASVLNTGSGRTQASLVTVGLGGQGKVSLYNAAGTTHVLVDVAGYYTATTSKGAGFHAISPIRVLDTRATSALRPGTTTAVPVTGALKLDADTVSAVVVNVTTVSPGGQGYVVAWGSGTKPGVSTVNLQPGTDVANRAVVPVSGGKIQLASAGVSVDAVVDVVGWFGAVGDSGGDLFTPVVPERVLDTRSSSALGASGERTVSMGSVVPSGASAVVGSLVATGQTAPATHLRVRPAGQALAATSDLNAVRGVTQANAVVARLGSSRGVTIYNAAGSTHVLLDVMGYFD